MFRSSKHTRTFGVPDGSLLAVGGNTDTKGNLQGKVIVWDVQSGKRLWETVLPFPLGQTFDSIEGLTWSPDNSRLVLQNANSNLTILDGTNGAIVETVPFGRYQPCLLAFTANGNLLAIHRSSRADEKNLVLWSWPGLKEIWSANTTCNDADLSDDGKTVVIGNGDDNKGVSIIDLETRTIQENLFVRSSGTNATIAVAINPDKSQIAVGYYDGHIIKWDTQTHQPITEKEVYKDTITSIDWQPDNKRIASSAFDNIPIDVIFKLNTIHVSRTDSQRGWRIWTGDKVASQVEFTPDNNWLMYVLDNRVVLHKLR
jgi:WD40 repeat protein